MGAAWVLLVIFMALVCVEGQKTVESLSSALLSSSGWKPNDNTYLVSSNGTFCAGFYNVTANRYAFAVWYANDSERTMAWMANSTSLVGGNSSLNFKDGALSITDENGVIAWSKETPNAMNLVLQETGNLVFNQWQSFKEFPTFNLLPTQDFTTDDILLSRFPDGTYGRGGNYYSLSLEKQSNTLSLNYYSRKEEGRSPQNYWQSGTFLGVSLDEIGFLNKTIIEIASMIMASDRGEKDRLRRLTLEGNGNLLMYSRKRYPPSSSWDVVWEAVSKHCQIPGVCGDNAVCKINLEWEPSCECPPGFDLSPVDNRSCKPHNDVKKLANVTFVPLDFVNFEGSDSTDKPATILQDCIEFCRSNSSCMGFAYKLEKGNCVHLFGKLFNGYWSPGEKTRMYLKISAKDEESDLNLFHGLLSVVNNVCSIILKIPFPPTHSNHRTRDLIIIFSLFGLEVLCGAYAFAAFLRKYSKFRDMARIFALDLLPSVGPKKFSYAELKAATNDFSNMLGKGGFGPVYRGLLPDQRQIAVKKLEGLHYGEQHFWAEVTIIGRIHHLNLVRMWGFCAEGEHRLVVYEYIPNGSLEKHLFDTEGGISMEWGVRYRIALGVARAIAYLHEECLEWVLHCDIKPENILIDENFCPKVSDFGLAKLVEKEHSLNVSKIRGTRGYLAPEWFETKSITAKVDVYSFGMVLLEIVRGKRNLHYSYSTEQDTDYHSLQWAFEMVMIKGKPEEVMDKRLKEIAENQSEMDAVQRVVKTALWCIQSRAEDRPSMGKVAKMLEGAIEIDDPPMPSQFFDSSGGGPQLPLL